MPFSSQAFGHPIELTELFAELTELGSELSELSLPKPCSQHGFPPQPNMLTLAILIPPPHHQNGPPNEFPGIPWTKGFCLNFTETLNLPGPSRFRSLLGGSEVDMLGRAEFRPIPTYHKAAGC